tara:strand:+ start:1054 stop:1395 length:342 start_codon:yes stop_codon:yes gene_type:complete
MTTRCNIKITDDYGGELWFYRHSDGYPKSVMTTLEPLMDKLRKGLLRDNVGQFAGWLIVIGHYEYKDDSFDEEDYPLIGWKCGAYEPTTGQHGDIDYLYHIDLSRKSLMFERV